MMMGVLLLKRLWETLVTMLCMSFLEEIMGFHIIDNFSIFGVTLTDVSSLVTVCCRNCCP
jgi:hypothetical protein